MTTKAQPPKKDSSYYSTNYRYKEGSLVTLILNKDQNLTLDLDLRLISSKPLAKIIKCIHGSSPAVPALYEVKIISNNLDLSLQRIRYFYEDEMEEFVDASI